MQLLDLLNTYASLIQSIASIIALGISAFVYWKQREESNEAREISLYEIRYQVYTLMTELLLQMIWDTPYNYMIGEVDKEEHKKYIERMNYAIAQFDQIEDRISFTFDEKFAREISEEIKKILIVVNDIKSLHINHMTKLEMDDRSGIQEWCKKIENCRHQADEASKKMRLHYFVWVEKPSAN